MSTGIRALTIRPPWSDLIAAAPPQALRLLRAR